MGQARELLDRMTAAALEAHDVDATVGCYSDDAVVMTPDVGEVKGRQQIADYWRQFIDGFPDGRWEEISKVESGNKAVDEGYFIGTNTGALLLPTGESMEPTGKQVKIRSVDIATVENGKITEHHLYFDELDFQRQLGLVAS
jgi:predicted ester cyclase